MTYKQQFYTISFVTHKSISIIIIVIIITLNNIILRFISTALKYIKQSVRLADNKGITGILHCNLQVKCMYTHKYLGTPHIHRHNYMHM